MKFVAALVMSISASCVLGSPERVSELVADLATSSGESLTRTQLLLMNDDPIVTLEDIESVAASMDLNADLLQRLELAALTRFRNQHPKGGLGVSFGAARIGYVEIQTIVGTDAFPAAAMLKPGDVIVEVSGKIVQGSEHFRAEILSRQPGETIPVVLKRGELLLKRDLPLGAFSNLTGAANIEAPVLRQALALRRERLGITLPAPDTIGAEIDTAAWIDAAFPDGPAASIEQKDEAAEIGAILVGRARVIFAGYPLYPRRGKVWSSQGLAEQAVLDTQRAELNAKISDGFARRAQLVARIKSVRTIAEERDDLEALDPEIQMLLKEQSRVEREIHRLSIELDKLDPLVEDPKSDDSDGD